MEKTIKIAEGKNLTIKKALYIYVDKNTGQEVV
jgi:hypothetical protein